MLRALVVISLLWDELTWYTRDYWNRFVCRVLGHPQDALVIWRSATDKRLACWRCGRELDGEW